MENHFGESASPVFCDPDEGTVFLEGRDIRTIPPEELRPKFGVVFQNDFIMEGTLAGNIRFCRELPQEEEDRAARTAPGRIIFQSGMAIPWRFQGANNLSGGQKQRLTIARAWQWKAGHFGAGRCLQRAGLPD